MVKKLRTSLDKHILEDIMVIRDISEPNVHNN